MSNPDWTEVVTAVASVVSAIGVGFAGAQIHFAKRALVHDHERSRRERTLELVRHYIEATSEELNCARRFAQELSAENARSLAKGEALSIASPAAEWAGRCLNKTLEANGGLVTVSLDDARRLQSRVIRYLNLLETVMMARRHNVGDRSIIDEQFNFLVHPAHCGGRLTNVLEALESYPGVAEFYATHAKPPRAEGKPATGR